MDRIAKISGVDGVHDCHVWSMDGEYNVMTVDLTARETMPISEQENIKEQVWEIMSEEDIHHITIEFDSSTNEFNHPEETGSQ